MSHFYDNGTFSYQEYWTNRQYEHQCETLALQTLIKHRRFDQVADIGGGFGRLLPVLAQFTTHLTLVEPSSKHRLQASQLKIKNINLTVVNGTAEKTTLPSSSIDLAVCVRVLHHLPHPDPVFQEFTRIVKPNGFLIIEFANSLHFKARLDNWIKGTPILPTPIERRSPAAIRQGMIPFVNHHPHSIFRQLSNHGFRLIQTLSVSNFRSQFIKKVVPLPLLIGLEYLLQRPLSKLYFGPSIFVLAQRVSGERSRTIDKRQNP